MTLAAALALPELDDLGLPSVPSVNLFLSFDHAQPKGPEGHAERPFPVDLDVHDPVSDLVCRHPITKGCNAFSRHATAPFPHERPAAQPGEWLPIEPFISLTANEFSVRGLIQIGAVS